MINLKKLLFYFFIVSTPCMHAMNLLRPYDTLIRPSYSMPPADASVWWQLGFIAEGGVSNKGFNRDAHSVDVTKIWQCTQDALTMLDGFPDESAIGQKRIAVDANDDGTRGHFNVCGNLDTKFAGSIALRSFFLHNWSLSFYLPFYVQELKDVSWCDLTKDLTDDDARVKQLLTNDIVANVCELGGLEICGWQRKGVGDLTVLAEWFGDFPQPKPMLRNVRVHWRVGLGIPTGLRQDEDKILALPFGNDGAFSIPFGMGLDLSFIFHLRCGFNVDLMHTFGNTRCRRIQTAINQTDLLFLQKVEAYQDTGLTQYFSLYAQLFEVWGGEAFMLGYEYTKRGSNELSFNSEEFSVTTANLATHLQDWTMHQFIVRADYNFGVHMDPGSYVMPRISLYTRIPFNGKRVAANTMIGATFAIDF